ncbi:MAG: hypothetical protein CVU55_02710 [Deltaproteobacteria bacterium HGW-Deltaproteobacteria-13]|jgi:hypothetical protein|nr:MAG: hypothetical protein CVU55_02710 [Deltaproteobacteria bacterium HGW-Deltaproteobacteria-13]
MPTGALVIVVEVPPDENVADATMLVAPAESGPAAFKLTEAMPVVVKAEAEIGVNVTRLLVAEKVTTAPLTSEPPASRSVAVAVTGVPNLTLDGTLKVREGVRVVVLLPVPVPVSPLLPHPIRQQNKTKEINRNNSLENFALIDFTMLLSF